MLREIRRSLINMLRDLSIGDSSHDLYHLLRVEKTALELQREQGEGDVMVISIASLLHDLISFPKNDPRRSLSSLHSADRATEILRQHKIENNKIEAIHHCIHAHSFSASIVPQTIEAKIVQDADRMEALGAIGIARCFYTSGLLKRELFHPIDPMAQDRSLDDLQYALDHFSVKLLKLPEMMQTKAGSVMAKKRAEFLQLYSTTLVREIFLDPAVDDF